MQTHSNLLQTDWRTLIVLDACRFDAFENALYRFRTRIDGVLVEADSAAYDTSSWYRKHWAQSNDITLVCGNPMVWRISANKNFDHAIACWRGSQFPVPENILRVATDSVEHARNNRVIVHLVTPHLPFVTKDGIGFMNELGNSSGEVGAYNLVTEYGGANGWEYLRELYQDSILLVLHEIVKVLGKLPEPVVITADHGELIGENGIYGHPRSGFEITRCVPWFVVQSDEKKIEQRLTELGYVEENIMRHELLRDSKLEIEIEEEIEEETDEEEQEPEETKAVSSKAVIRLEEAQEPGPGPVPESDRVLWIRARQRAQEIYGPKRLPDSIIEQFLD